jgi:type VI secretion system protein ImpH
MARSRRRSPRDLNQELRDDPGRFGFFQAVRLLALAQGKGHGKKQVPNRLRFRSLASLSFPASEITDYQPAAGKGDERDEMTVGFMGLTGPNGALPTVYTELLLERRLRYRDDGMHAFFDVFGHRATSLFYQAWRKYRYWLEVEAGGQDGFTRQLLDLGGLGLAPLRRYLARQGQPGENLFVHFSGLLSQKPLSAQALESVVQGFFGTQARLEQFVGHWVQVPRKEQSRLGVSECVLGSSLMAGSRLWDRQTKLRLRLGPMDGRLYRELQPGGAGVEALEALFRFAFGHALAVDVCLVLQGCHVPPACLGAAQALQLGGNCWLGPQQHDPDAMRYALLR